MPRLDVFTNPIAEQRREVPYCIDVQADALRALGTRVVIPLRRARSGSTLAERLNPLFEVEQTKVFLDTANIATFPAHRLTKRVGSLADHRFDVDNALDFLFQGL
jgi:toxin CcdB